MTNFFFANLVISYQTVHVVVCVCLSQDKTAMINITTTPAYIGKANDLPHNNN